tara:strand:- start:1491 stop:1721 length:231 start_codon:yes stop_codon:yes gene_type:complete
MNTCTNLHGRVYAPKNGELGEVYLCEANKETEAISKAIQNKVTLILCENHKRPAYEEYDTYPGRDYEKAMIDSITD